MGKRILLLDDDQGILDIVSYLLVDSGFEVETQANGEAVFAVIGDFQPDLVLMDVMLAEMDGRLICRALKANVLTGHIPVILISGTHDLAQSLHQQGAPNDFLAKPFDLDVLLNKVNAQLT
ncbi:response regulator transcription factor [Mucilaginibacter sp. L3T2-6]|uniref:response regulator transcription factor n=1 Tax=Mucilaginibacter sp. L3T2-6 TaxID=3062491 RepID=UPI00267752FB|nr:response regulator [Mucilaginibacter sp. L3T2-6]MDO3645246.1 response regulator [Mucilaginibacter sp. L3T2-6]MDV6217698.1 response regulator [Mucilaginibacter sp. L3T2-6]